MLYARIPFAMSAVLPKDRAYTKLEAAFQCEMDTMMSIKRSGWEYAKMFGWSRGKVSRFFDELRFLS